MGIHNISACILIVGLIVSCCYLRKREENYNFYYKVIYISFMINIWFILFTVSTPYWAILLVSWLVLVIYCNGQNRKFNILIEIIGISSFMIWHMARKAYFFNSGNCEGMLIIYYLLGESLCFGNGLGAVIESLSQGTLSFVFNICKYAFNYCMLCDSSGTS